GIDALVLLGTTGEPCTLSMDERERVIAIGLETAGERVPVIIGTGSNDTRRAIEYARQARKLGAQGQLSVTPYYNKTTQNGLIRHYSAILDSCDLPMILYNVPSRTGMSMNPDTLAQLAVHPNVAGLKEASGDLSLAADFIQRTHGELPLYCGNDDLIVPLMALGVAGAISVCSNILPLQTRLITFACRNGCFDEASDAQQALLPLMRALFAQVNPIPVKAALAMMGLIHDVVRLPLVPMDEPQRSRLQRVLEDCSLIARK
ncbi:MAG: 4-hydroxy-tetrahydrodipicolinate synthase, partial [Candidatus Ventricola sp.]|nr:4-hydroxy-tetrahydrodipicolinate synthase [Candidatus Ventricola sp.]